MNQESKNAEKVGDMIRLMSAPNKKKVDVICLDCETPTEEFELLTQQTFYTGSRCDSCQEIYNIKIDEQASEDRLKRIQKRREESVDSVMREELGCPRDPNGYSSEGYNLSANRFDDNPTQKKLPQRLITMMSAKVNICLYSVPNEKKKENGRGVGKTRMALASMRHWLLSRPRVSFDKAHFIEAQTFTNMMHGKFPSEREPEIKEMAEKWFLVIDDIGYEKHDYIGDILLRRLNDGKPTFLTSNLSEQGFADKYGMRIYSRFCQIIEGKNNGVFIHLHGQDYRLTGGK